MNATKIVDFKDISNTYREIPLKQVQLLHGRKWLPVKKDSEFARECAYLVGKVMGDGHLDCNFTTAFIGSETEVKNLKQIIERVCKIEPKKLSIRSKKARGVSYILKVHDALLGRLLFKLGAPMGNKTKQAFSVPKWIYKSKENSRMFLRALLEDELTTIKIEKKNYSIQPRLKMSKCEEFLPDLREFLQQIRTMLKLFDVNCGEIIRYPITNRDQKAKELYFHINRNKENIIKFGKQIGFRASSMKIKKLKECVRVLEETRYNRKPFIDTQKIVYLRGAGYSIRQISKLVNLNATSVHRVIREKNMRGA